MRENLAIIVAIMLVFAVVGIAYHAGMQEGGRGLYPDTCIIVEMDYAEDLVTVSDVCGILWRFYGCEDYTEGDLVRVLMYDNGTPRNIYDDQIVIVWYAGTLEQFENIWRGE